MRQILAALIALTLATAPVALAQADTRRPAEPAPAASAPYEARENWCVKYASWYIEHVPGAASTPSDVRPTQRFENELVSCKIDPRTYQRETLAEVRRLGTASQG